MNYIALPNNKKIYIDFREQVGSKGENFRLSGVSVNSKMPAKWVKENGKNIEKYHWIYCFRYLETNNFFKIEINYYDKFKCKL